MDCYEMQERILEGFEGSLTPEEKGQLESHLSECPRCAQFAAIQSQLDVRLQEAISPPQLRPSFRVGLHARMAQVRREPWPDWLPDVAHLAGSAVAIGSCALFLPVPVPVVLGVGTVVALIAYSLQTLMVGTLEQWTE
jgi:anti-sigma factor RsiW